MSKQSFWEKLTKRGPSEELLEPFLGKSDIEPSSNIFELKGVNRINEFTKKAGTAVKSKGDTILFWIHALVSIVCIIYILYILYNIGQVEECSDISDEEMDVIELAGCNIAEISGDDDVWFWWKVSHFITWKFIISIPIALYCLSDIYNLTMSTGSGISWKLALLAVCVGFVGFFVFLKDEDAGSTVFNASSSVIDWLSDNVPALEINETADAVRTAANAAQVIFDEDLDDSLTTDRFYWDIPDVVNPLNPGDPGYEERQRERFTDCTPISITGNVISKRFYKKNVI